ncbi:MAG: lytic transglycosylase domain-containing protein [Ferruginibacter sp.]
MKFYTLLFLFSLLTTGLFAQEQPLPLAINTADSSQVALATEKAIIDEVVTTKKAPKKEKVQYISQLTRYGFKNLFSKYKYNSSLPYSTQVNPHAEVYMQDYLQTHTSSLEKMKTWGLPYFNLIDNIFMQYGLPKELKYLAVIESNLSTGATSWVGAGGPWQFMPYTARDYGLVVNGAYDERRDYYKSTHAAARYLLSLYKDMHDWLLVIAAYNGGPGRVYSAMKKSGSRDFWALQYYLPQESRNHVKKFIATHYIMEGNGDFTGGTGQSSYATEGGMAGKQNIYTNSASLSEEERSSTETQTISGKFNSLIIAKNLAIDIGQFNKYNPDFDNRLGMNGQFDLMLPAEKMQLFLANKYQILNECVQVLLNDDGSGSYPNTKTSYPYRYQKSKKKKV